MLGLDQRTKAWGASAALVLGVGAAVSTAFGADDGDPPAGPPSAVAVASQDGTPALPNTPGSGVAGEVVGPVPTVKRKLKAGDVMRLPSARRCVRSIRIKTVRPSGHVLHGIRVRAGARTVVRRNVPKTLTIRLLPGKRFHLRVTVTADGRMLTAARDYRPCS